MFASRNPRFPTALTPHSSHVMRGVSGGQAAHKRGISGGAVHHVAYETGRGLVETGRTPPQKIFELAYQLRRDCGVIHGVVFLVCVSTSHYSEDHSGEATLLGPVA